MSDEEALGPRLKVERAKEHINDLVTEIKAFVGRDPYEVRKDVEPDTGHHVYRIHIREQLPPRWGVIVGDVVHNLRSSLDLLACGLVRANGGTVTRQTGFPISDGAKEFVAGLAKVKGVRKEALDLIKEAKPYKGGNDALWYLHRLNIADKHRLLIPVTTADRSLILRIKLNVPWQDEPIRAPEIALLSAAPTFPLEDGDEIWRLEDPVAFFEHHDEPKFAFDVTLGESEVLAGKPVVPELLQLTNTVEALIEAFVPLL